MMATTFWGPDGKPLSSAEFIHALYGSLPELFRDEDELRAIWSKPDTRKRLLQGLEEKGFGGEQLAEVSRMIDAEDSDLYDVLAYIAFAFAPISRRERVESHKEMIFTSYTNKQQQFLAYVLDHYVAQGVSELDQERLPGLLQSKYFTLYDAEVALGGMNSIRDMFVGFQQGLYLPLQRN
jgi:type I restriction enzyme, R subunit